MRFIRHFCLCLASLLPIHEIGAQVRINRSLGVNDGLVQSQVFCIHEDQKGYMWFGTFDGLSRWDGINFANFQTQDGLASAQVFDIHESRTGTLYFATGAGVSIYRDAKFETFHEDSGLVNQSVRCIYEGADGSLYFGTDAGVSIYKSGGFSTLEGLHHQRVRDIHEAADGTLYIATSGGGVHVYRNNRRVQILSEKNGLASNRVWCIAGSRDGTLFFGTLGAGASVYRNHEIVQTLNRANGLAHNHVYAIHESRDGKLLFGTWGGGVSVYENGDFETLNESNGLINNRVFAIHESQDGTFYFGTDGGVSIYPPGRFASFNDKSGLAHNSVYSIFEAPDGSFYFGTDGGGVSVFKDGTLIKTLDEESGLANNTVMAICGGTDGTLYFGTFGGGVSIYQNRRFRNLNESAGLANNNVRALYLDRKEDILYIGTNAGVSLYQKGRLTTLDENTGLADDRVHSIYEDRSGTIYFGTENGVQTYKNGKPGRTLTRQDGLANDIVYSIYQGRDGTLYFGTWGGGLGLYKQGKLRSLDVRHGLSNNTVYGVLEDNEGRIYVCTNRGVNVLVFSEGDTTIRTIRQSDGLISDECNKGAGLKDRRGRLWFGTIQGATCYNPRYDLPHTVPPKVHITRFRLFERDIPLDSSAEIFNFTYNENYLKFDFIGIHLPAPQKVTYRYRLPGIDHDWVETKERFVQYTNLNPDNYVFQVKAKNEWGYWSDPAELAFVITPPFWKTWWFQGMAVLMVLGFLWLIHQLRVSRLLAIEHLRVRIASDLHDDIGSTLTRIASSSEIIQTTREPDKIRKTARKIGGLSREIIQTMSDVVWSIDARNDSAGELVNRMKDFAYQALTPGEINVRFDINGIDLDKTLSVNLRQNLYLIFKEAITNVAKHADASDVEVNLHNKRGKFIMRIKDNGKGLPDKPDRKGNGLRNMEMRAKRIGCDIDVANDGGATVQIVGKAIH